MTNKQRNYNGGIADITNINLCDVALERAMERTPSLPGIVCLYGPSGFGKSIAATCVANRRRAYYVQAKSVWTKKFTLIAILQEMGIKPAATIPEMLEQAAQELAMSGRPLIVDEMDHLVEKKQVEVIRDLYEASQGTIMIIGEEQLPMKLKKWERFHGRVLAWVGAQKVSLDDVRKLIPLYANQIEIAEDMLLHLIDISGGSVRRVVVNLELIQDTALTRGLELVDRKSWGKTELYTGMAPSRRLS